jgi:DNA polymerase V
VSKVCGLLKSDIVLKPENPAYKPIEVTKRKDFEIWGVVTYIVHRA